MFKGEKTCLRRLNEKDADIIIQYWNNYELRQYLPSPLPTNHDEMLRFIETKNVTFEKRTEFFFGIESMESFKLIGIIGLNSISWISRHAFISHFCIFNPDTRGKGYGKDSLLVLLDFAFSVIDLHSIVLWVEA